MEDLKKQYKLGLYERIKDNGYNFAKIIVPELVKEFPIKSVLDVGCGGASFLHGCKDIGLEVFGVDGEHTIPSLQINKKLFYSRNLEEPLCLGKFFDLVVSLEVAEHIDNKYADIFIDSICIHSDLVLFSAAQVGQPGINHINCRPLEYWIKKFEDRGYRYSHDISNRIRKNGNIYNWYRKNALFFGKI